MIIRHVLSGTIRTREQRTNRLHANIVWLYIAHVFVNKLFSYFNNRKPFSFRMSSRHKRIYHKRSKAKHVICVSCNALLKFDHGQKLYRQRYPLTNRLQDRRWDPSLKPGISILEGLIETIPELAVGDVSHFLSAMYICHGKYYVHVY